MTTYVALLRAINVGGTGKLPMNDLVSICSNAGFLRPETYIASGNVVFDSKASPVTVKRELERRLYAYAGKPIGVAVRKGSEMASILRANPFPKAPPNFVYVLFLDEKPAKDTLDGVTGLNGEQIHLGKRELYIHYRHGMGKSKLKIPAARSATARNMNTVAALAKMAAR
jgi:uncharacterized protein (DUF1697 family)